MWYNVFNGYTVYPNYFEVTVMEELEKHSCCFFGHRKIKETPALKERLIREIEVLITEKKVVLFYFGSKSEFDALCHTIVTGLKQKYPHIKRVYVRSAFPHISERYKERLMERYEDTYFPERIENAGRAACLERNREMINNSEFCIVYFDKNYTPPKRKVGKRDIAERQPRSGTAVAYSYAVRRKKKIVNVIEV